MKFVRGSDVQIEVAQRVMKAFLESKSDTFASFATSWEQEHGHAIRTGASPQPLLYGDVQTAFSTFIGFSGPSYSPKENRGCIFGLYILRTTDPSPHAPLILISARELRQIAIFCRNPEESEARSILSHLLRTGSVCFSAVDVAIHSPRDLVVSPAVVDERNVTSGIFETSRGDAEEKRAVEDENVDGVYERYEALMRKITS